jgi:hypothetical protein
MNDILHLKDFPSEENLLKAFGNPFAEPPLPVNAHVHTPYSFSAFETMTDLFTQAMEENIRVLGITDFITVEGYDEFHRLACEHNIFPLFNIEFMGLMQEEQQKGIRINDPNNPGRMYFCGKGLSFPVVLSEFNRTKLQNVYLNSISQTQQMVSLLNDYLKKLKAGITLDFEEIRGNLTKGLVRERHIAKALRMKILAKYGKAGARQEFLKILYDGKDSMASSGIAGDLDNELRANLLKKGGVAFVEEDPTAFLSVKEIRDIILDARGIPCYPVLLDDAKGNFTDFEADLDELIRNLTRNRIYAVELIPGRNDFSNIKKFTEIFSDKGFLITFGTEHNTPDPAPLTVSCRGGIPLDEDLKAVNYQSACVIAAHQYSIAKGKPGYVTPEGFPRLEKQDDFIAIGNAVIRKFIGNKVNLL